MGRAEAPRPSPRRAPSLRLEAAGSALAGFPFLLPRCMVVAGAGQREPGGARAGGGGGSGAEPSHSAQEAPGSGHCSQEVRRRRKSYAREREGGNSRKRESGALGVLHSLPERRLGGSHGTGWDGTGRGGSQPVPASLRAVGPEGACSPRPLHSREGAAEALHRDSGRLGRDGRALRSRGPLAPCGAGCGEGERRPKGSALLLRSRTLLARGAGRWQPQPRRGER